MSDAKNRTAVVVDDQQFKIDGKTEPLYGGAVHYWRLDRDKWPSILQSVKSMGFNMISIYIPWEIHEVSKGVFDFEGNKDIDAFLSLCEGMGFKIVVRPGPQINSELTWFGYPKRILENHRLHAKNALGGSAVLTQVPKPIPSLNYASDEFFEEVIPWYDAICEILARHVHPNGGIVACQVDNEMANFFCINAYSTDFSEDSIRNYRAFVLDKYGDLAGINAAYRKQLASLEELDAPRRFEGVVKEDIPWYADWVAYREHYLIASMKRLANMLRERDLDEVALFHNYPHPLGPGGAASGFTTPFNIAKLEEELDFVGFDIYSRKELYGHVKTIGSYVVGTSRYPYIPEFIAGVWPWYLNPGELYDEEFVTKAALMQGIKGFSRYMLVERDRWLDSPVRRDGRVREDHAAMFSESNEVQLKYAFSDLKREANVLLLANREYDRLEAAAVLVSFPGDFLETPSTFSEYANPLTVSENTLGFSEPVQLKKTHVFGGLYSALAEGSYDFVLSDTDLSPTRWPEQGVVVLPTLEYLAEDTQSALVAYAKSGGHVVVGPKIPELDSLMKQCTILKAGVDSLPRNFHVVEEGTDVKAVIDAACAAAGSLAVTKNDVRLDVVVHGSRTDRSRKIVFVANPMAEGVDAAIGLGRELASVTSLWSSPEAEVNGDQIAVHLPAYTIAVFECSIEQDGDK